MENRGPSRALWKNLFAELKNDPGRGLLLFDDFGNHPAHISAQTIGNYATYIDTGVTMKANAIVDLTVGQAGVLEVAGNDGTNDEGSISTGGGSGTFCKITDDANEQYGVLFECRVKKATVGNTTTCFVAGLAEEGLAAADTLTDATGALASKDFVGFQVLAAAGATVNFIYRKAGQALQTPLAAAATMTADTWVKLGFRYQPWASDDKKIAIFVNGVEQSTYVTATNIAAATFPDAEELCMLFATLNATTTTESKLSMDWWAAAQLFVKNPN